MIEVIDGVLTKEEVYMYGKAIVQSNRYQNDLSTAINVTYIDRSNPVWSTETSLEVLERLYSILDRSLQNNDLSLPLFQKCIKELNQTESHSDMLVDEILTMVINNIFKFVLDKEISIDGISSDIDEIVALSSSAREIVNMLNYLNGWMVQQHKLRTDNHELILDNINVNVGNMNLTVLPYITNVNIVYSINNTMFNKFMENVNKKSFIYYINQWDRKGMEAWDYIHRLEQTYNLFDNSNKSILCFSRMGSHKLAKWNLYKRHDNSGYIAKLTFDY